MSEFGTHIELLIEHADGSFTALSDARIINVHVWREGSTYPHIRIDRAGAICAPKLSNTELREKIGVDL